MIANCDRFDMTLAFAQWQGSARHANLPRGAAATAEICGQFAPITTVPMSDAQVNGHGIIHWGALYEQFLAAQAILTDRAPARILTAGGDCAVDVAVIDYLHGRYPDLSVIWADAHLDANSPATSPSGSFHGMPVRAIMGEAPDALQRHLRNPLSAEHFYYVGARAGDDGEWAYQQERSLRWLTAEQSIEGPVHLHFDLDVLDPVAFPYLAYPEPDGLAIAEALALVERIACGGNLVGLTITEFAPADGNEAQKGSKIIAQLCRAAMRSIEEHI